MRGPDWASTLHYLRTYRPPSAPDRLVTNQFKRRFPTTKLGRDSHTRRAKNNYCGGFSLSTLNSLNSLTFATTDQFGTNTN